MSRVSKRRMKARNPFELRTFAPRAATIYVLSFRWEPLPGEYWRESYKPLIHKGKAPR